MTAKNIFASFKTTGVYPFNRSAILLPGETTEDLQPSKHSLVKFLPMLSPLPSQRKFGTVRHCLDMESHSGQISQRDFSLQSEFSPQLPAQQIPVKVIQLSTVVLIKYYFSRFLVFSAPISQVCRPGRW
jgi:hypothetical protein